MGLGKSQYILQGINFLTVWSSMQGSHQRKQTHTTKRERSRLDASYFSDQASSIHQPNRPGSILKNATADPMELGKRYLWFHGTDGKSDTPGSQFSSWAIPGQGQTIDNADVFWRWEAICHNKMNFIARMSNDGNHGHKHMLTRQRRAMWAEPWATLTGLGRGQAMHRDQSTRL